MKRAAEAVLAAFAYFSVFPVPPAERPPDGDALLALPLVGAALGALAGGAALGLGALGAPPGLAAAAAFAVSVAGSGALHVDGFLDSCDALFAAVPPERRLEILKDPRHGSYAVAGMAVASLVWWSSLAALVPACGGRLPLALAASGSCARWTAVATARFGHDAREGVGSATLAGAPSLGGVAASGGACALLALANGPSALIIAIAAAGAGCCAAGFAARRLGGLTGDVYGFVIVVTEALFLAALAVAAGRT